MEIAIGLAWKIATLLMFVAAGFILVKTKVLKSTDCHPLSVLSLYLFSPCAILYSTQVEITQDVIEGLALAFCGCFLSYAILFASVWILAKVFKLSTIERLSVIYTNSANLIIPLIVATLGQDYVIYSMPFIAVQNVLIWTHMKSALEERASFDLLRVLKNVNIICIIASIPILVLNIKFPGFMGDMILTSSNFLGPACMLVAGMLIAATTLKEAFANPRVWLVTALRLVVVSGIATLIFKFVAPFIPVANAQAVMMIVLMATIAPSASGVVQMAQVHGKDRDAPRYGSAINTATLICCIITMPLMVALFQL